MANYEVVKDFKDLQDKGYVYRARDPFPREGVEVSEDRIQELSSVENKRKEILIKSKEPDNKKPEFEMENLTPESIKEQYTNDEIKARLDVLGIEYKSNDNKDKLIERLTSKEGDK